MTLTVDDLDLLSIEQTAAILHVTPRSLLNYRRRAHGPAPTRVGFRRIFYRRSDVDAYLAAMRDMAIDECIQSATGIPEPPEPGPAARPEIISPRRTRSPAAAPPTVAAIHRQDMATRAELDDYARRNAQEQ
jgi:hypothetical protein